MSRTIDQQIAETEAKLARLRTKSRSLENGQKIISGAVILNAARQNAKTRKWFIDEVEKFVDRETDKTRMEPLLVELRAMPTTDA